jgi:transcriptional regulator with XRE-family HTH domain
VWEVGHGETILPFEHAIAAAGPQFNFTTYVSFTRSPEDVQREHPGVDVLDLRTDEPAAALRRIEELCSRRGPGGVLLFEALDGLRERWGEPATRGFFTRCCPMLLHLGSVAYWPYGAGAFPKPFREHLRGITQCVVHVSEGRLSIVKAEGRSGWVQGTVLHYRIEDGKPDLRAAPAAARLGTALRAIRAERQLTQSDLARLAGVSPSAISQAERGQRGLSLETLLALTERLGITLDELLRGEADAGYRLARRVWTGRGGTAPLLDDPRSGLRSYGVRLAPGAVARPSIQHKGAEIVAVARGLVQVVLTTGTPVLRAGEALLLERATIESWRNLGDDEALVFWILRD